jgi:hypothetical protein
VAEALARHARLRGGEERESTPPPDNGAVRATTAGAREDPCHLQTCHQAFAI